MKLSKSKLDKIVEEIKNNKLNFLLNEGLFGEEEKSLIRKLNKKAKDISKSCEVVSKSTEEHEYRNNLTAVRKQVEDLKVLITILETFAHTKIDIYC